MSKDKKTADCEGCGLKRRLTRYDGRQYTTRMDPDSWLCLSCANVLGVTTLTMGYEGKLLLQINSKLDLLMRKTP